MGSWSVAVGFGGRTAAVETADEHETRCCQLQVEEEYSVQPGIPLKIR